MNYVANSRDIEMMGIGLGYPQPPCSGWWIITCSLPDNCIHKQQTNVDIMGITKLAGAGWGATAGDTTLNMVLSVFSNMEIQASSNNKLGYSGYYSVSCLQPYYNPIPRGIPDELTVPGCWYGVPNAKQMSSWHWLYLSAVGFSLSSLITCCRCRDSNSSCFYNFLR